MRPSFHALAVAAVLASPAWADPAYTPSPVRTKIITICASGCTQTSGPYVPSSGIVLAEVWVVGGGGGGGGGAYATAAAGASGGAGGGAAAPLTAVYSASGLGASVTVTLGTAGTGGAGGVSGSANGVAGTSGTDTIFAASAFTLTGWPGGGDRRNSAAPPATAPGAAAAGGDGLEAGPPPPCAAPCPGALRAELLLFHSGSRSRAWDGERGGFGRGTRIRSLRSVGGWWAAHWQDAGGPGHRRSRR